MVSAPLSLSPLGNKRHNLVGLCFKGADPDRMGFFAVNL
jgi:hypothetical protein